MPTLISTVKSFMTSDVYGHAGDEVNVIAYYGNVVIAELNGNRFSVRKDNMTNDKREVEHVQVEEKKVLKKTVKKIKTTSPALF